MNQQQLLKNALELTHGIAAAARAGDWIEAARLADERSPLLLQVQNDQADATLALVREIQTLDASLMSDADDARMSLGKNYREAMARTTAANRYQQAARLF
jgi:flagellar protein FliT